MRRRLLFVALPFLSAALTLGVLAFRTSGPQPQAAERITHAVPLTQHARLSGWRAPGVPVVLSGFAGPDERVVLRANGRTVDTVTAGRRGAFRLRFAAARSGRYR